MLVFSFGITGFIWFDSACIYSGAVQFWSCVLGVTNYSLFSFDSIIWRITYLYDSIKRRVAGYYFTDFLLAYSLFSSGAVFRALL